MIVHHLNCGTMCPWGGRFAGGEGSLLSQGRAVCHCLLIEGRDGLVLVDTGIGLAECQAQEQVPSWFRRVIRPRLDAEETAVQQIRKLGYRPADVKHLVLTHLDLDHAGGVPDFPQAVVHVLAEEHDASFRPQSYAERARSFAPRCGYGPRFELHEARGETWFGFEAVRALEPRESDVLLIPLPGHTRGHAGVAVRTQRGWLLHAGDAYNSHLTLQAERSTPAILRGWERLNTIDRTKLLANRQRLRELARTHRDEVAVFSSHCATEFDRLHALDAAS